jgi:predicted RNA-binding protein YlqC (UPF0109 family)
VWIFKLLLLLLLFWVNTTTLGNFAKLKNLNMSDDTKKIIGKNGNIIAIVNFLFCLGIQEGSHNRTFPQEH